MNTYWERNGKYQDFVNSIKTPDWGYTTNPHLNAYIAMSNLYYDVYNNGGGNIKDCYQDAVELVSSEIGRINMRSLLNDNLKYVEDMANRLIEAIKDKDLSYDECGFYWDWKEMTAAMDKNLLNQSHEILYISFGDTEKMEHEYHRRKHIA